MNHVSGRFAATVLLLAATWTASMLSARRAPEELSRPLETIPLQIGDWVGTDSPPLDPEIESVLKASAYLSRTYRSSDGKQLGFFTAFYSLQKAGETMHSPKNCLPGSGWEIWRYSTLTLPVEGEPLTINQYGIQKGTDRTLILYWYQTSDRVIAGEYYAKACLIWDALVQGRTSGSIVRVDLPDQPWALDAGKDFAAQVIPLLRKCLPGSP